MGVLLFDIINLAQNTKCVQPMGAETRIQRERKKHIQGVRIDVRKISGFTFSMQIILTK